MEGSDLGEECEEEEASGGSQQRLIRGSGCKFWRKDERGKREKKDTEDRQVGAG
jgi:hypothetical protein